MKNLIIIALLFSALCAKAQIRGNGIQKEITVSASGIQSVELQLYANVTVDASAEEGITIMTDENLIDLIATDVVNGRLLLEQKEWIKPSQDIRIFIGAPGIQEALVDVHETLVLKNVNAENLKISAPIGKVISSGTVDMLELFSKKGVIDASLTAASKAVIEITGSGKIVVNANDIEQKGLSDRARLILTNDVEIEDELIRDAVARADNSRYKDLRTVSLKIKNNSWNRQNFYVVGPNRDGSTFSYGFPLMPGASRAERWTEGTEVYKKSAFGKKKLLVTISADDEGQTVKLFN